MLNVGQTLIERPEAFIEDMILIHLLITVDL